MFPECIPRTLPTPLKISLKGKNPYQLLILTDLHIPADMELKERILRSPLLRDINHAILLGDNVACYGEEKEYLMLKEFVENLPLPYTALNGNHEFMFRVHKFGSESYGRVWERNNAMERRRQLEKFYEFFRIEKPYWEEIISPFSYLFFTIGNYKEEKIEVLPEGGEEFLREAIRMAPGEGIIRVIIFCHAPLKGSEIEGFKYYDEKGDPFIYLEEETLKLIKKSPLKIYWISGHIHLHPEHPMAPLRRIGENLYQINSPPSWKWLRKKIEDVVPRRYENFYSLIIRVEGERIVFRIYDWRIEDFIWEQEV